MASLASQRTDSGPSGGRAKAVALLERLGTKAAGEVLKHLSPMEVQKVAGAFTQMRDMPRPERERLAEEALKEVARGGSAGAELMQFAHELLTGHAGVQAAERLLGERDGARTASDSLRWVPEAAAELLSEALEDENPRIAALVVSAVRSGVAARVVSLLPPEVRGEVLLHLAREKKPMPEGAAVILQRVGRLISRSHAARGRARSLPAAELRHGREKVAEILRLCDRNAEHSVVEYLQARAPEIAQQVSQSIFSAIDDLKWLDARSLQLVLREVETKQLARALRGTSDEVRNLCFQNLSENAAAELKEEIETLGPTPRREVEAAQHAIMENVRSMLEEERIQVAQAEEDLV